MSLLPQTSKAFERVIYKQINSFAENEISKCVKDFRKSYGTQHSLIFILQKWKKNLSHIYDLSKFFDTINHGISWHNLKTCSFSKQALSSMCSYIKKRRQKAQINNKSSSLKEVIVRVPEGSVDGPLLFKLFINNLFLFLCFRTPSNYADGNDLFTTGTVIQLIKQKASAFIKLSDSKQLVSWNMYDLKTWKMPFHVYGQKNLWWRCFLLW